MLLGTDGRGLLTTSDILEHVDRMVLGKCIVCSLQENYVSYAIHVVKAF